MTTQAATMIAHFDRAPRAGGSGRPRIGLALGWLAYIVFYLTVAGCLLAPAFLFLRLLGAWPG